jgi:hypothetical protein
MSGTYSIIIRQGVTTIFKGSFVVDITQTPNIIAFYEEGNLSNILAPAGSWINSDNAFVSRSYPFSPDGVSITTMSYYPGNYGSNTTDSTYNFYSDYTGVGGLSVTRLRNFNDIDYSFTITGGPVYPPFPRDGSIPPVCFYTIQGLPTYLNQNSQYKVYYSDNPQFPYLTVYADNLYPDVAATYDLTTVPLPPFLTNLSQLQAQQYQAQLALFRKVYDYNYNAYINYVNHPNSAGPVYYRFNTYADLNNYKAGLQLANRLYPFDLMANAYDQLTGVPLRWVVPFPM